MYHAVGRTEKAAAWPKNNRTSQTIGVNKEMTECVLWKEASEVFGTSRGSRTGLEHFFLALPEVEQRPADRLPRFT